MLIPEAAETEKAQNQWQANYGVVEKVSDQDFVIGDGIQAGLNAGANHTSQLVALKAVCRWRAASMGASLINEVTPSVSQQ